MSDELTAADSEANELAYKARDILDRVQGDKLMDGRAEEALAGALSNLYDLIQFTEAD